MTRPKPIAHVVMSIALSLLLLPPAAHAQPFVDDFEDGSVTDGHPVQWGPMIAPWDQGSAEVVNGDLLLTPSLTAQSFPETPNHIDVFAVAGDRIFQDVSIHTQGRISGQGQGSLGVAVRETLTLGADYPGANVFASVLVDTDSQKYIALGGWTGTAPAITQFAPTLLNIHETDVHLQLDIFGNSAKLFVWEDGNLKPTRPVLSSRLAAGQMVEGNVHVWYSQLRPPVNELNTATFRFVEVVPEPSSAVLGGLGLLKLMVLQRRKRK